ncbi:galactitol 2-dehydrogenase [Saccharopolyspora halophila]|uniref:Galactitol 2-dehydrogenase n=1 Tax=Saccharopolyspora halophila TaxID=405551 RepID=A0ABN3G456_9PSEU
MQLRGKITIITGAASGMGRAMALGYAAEGAHVVVADLDERGGAGVVEEIESSGGSAQAERLDVADPADSRDLVSRVVEEHGRLDGLVNNAGVGLIKPVWETTQQEWERIFSINVTGLFFCSQAALEPMRRQGRGKIVNLASIAGRRGEALVAAYCASKAAVISITQSVALAAAPHGVQVNAMAPGVVDTPYWKDVDRQFGELLGKEPGQHFADVSESIPLGRAEQPADVVPLAVFLAGEGSDYITGQTYNVDGGLVTS